MILCSWCGCPVAPKAPRMRLFESEGVRTDGKTIATFHPECGDDLLNACEKRVSQLIDHRAIGRTTVAR